MKRPGRKSAAELSVVPAGPPAVAGRHVDVPAPTHLSPAAARFWTETVAEFELAPHHLLILQAACEQLDLVAMARAELAAHGALALVDLHGRVTSTPHPAAGIQRHATIALARLLRELDLDTSSFAAFESRPPALRGNRG